MSTIRSLFLISLVFVLTGCASSDPNYFPAIGLKMPPKKSKDDVEVRTMPPTRAFAPLGLLNYGSTRSWGKIIRKTSEQAAKIGADFVWLADSRVQSEYVWIPGFSTFSARGSAYGYGYGNWFTAQAQSSAGGFSVGPSVRRVERGSIIALAGVYYPARLGVVWDSESQPKCVIKDFQVNALAQDAGLQQGDEVIAIDSIGMNEDALPRHLLTVRPGQKVRIDIVRDGARMKFDVPAIPN